VITTISVRFENLERFEGEVTLDISTYLTTVVGPNGSGKSTLLEAAAEVLAFLAPGQIERPASDVRKSLETNARPTHPKWERAVVVLTHDAETQPVVGTSLAKHVGTPSAEVAFEIAKRGDGQRWTLSGVAVGGQWCRFDTSGPIVVDSRRKKEVEQQREAFLAEHRTVVAKNEEAFTATSANMNAEGNPAKKAALLKQVQSFEAMRQTLGQTHQQKERAFQQEIQAATAAAIRTTSGEEVTKADVEALRGSISTPGVVYLHGVPAFGERITRMTTQLGRRRDARRSELEGSPYLEMRDRIRTLLRMDVAIDSTKDPHVLLIDDRPEGELSTGTWYALGFAAIREEGGDTLVIWDEPETGLHPTWARSIADLMAGGPLRFLVATHRTEFVGSPERTRAYKTLAHPPERGQKAVCRLAEVKGLSALQAVATTLGLEPSRVLFTSNAVLWVEGPSDAIYWRFWLTCEAASRGVKLLEGPDYSFMFTGGTLLSHETFVDGDQALPTDAVNLLRLCGASLVIVDTDFNPGAVEGERITRAELDVIVPTVPPFGFVSTACRTHLKRQVRELVEAIEALAVGRSRVLTTWGREAESALTDESFRATLKKLYGLEDASPSVVAIDALKVDDWLSYDDEIERSLSPFVGKTEHKRLWRKHDGKEIVARMTKVRDKAIFAELYVETMRPKGLDSVRPQARVVVREVFDWIVNVKKSYLQ
jgi:ABC-type cobalamin/Fe3+-siderophores transport system ATPase subunit